MGNLTIRARLLVLVAFMTLALLLVGGFGIYAAKSSESDLKNIYEHQTVPMREVARVRRLMIDNAGQVFRAIQHNPASDYAKIHDHPIARHLDIVTKNMAWMDETFASLKKNLLPDSEEIRILADIEVVYNAYTADVLKPAVKALEAGNYSYDTVANFLKGNNAFEGRMNPLMTKLTEAQQNAVKAGYEHATKTTQQEVFWSVVIVALAVGAGLFLSLLTIRAINQPLAEIQSVIVRASRDRDFTGRVAVKSADEVGTAAQAFNDLLTNLCQTLAQVRDSTVRIDEATAALATASTQASRASGETSESAAAMAASVEEMSVSITSVSDSTHEALSIAQEAGHHSETGGAVIASAVSDMTQSAQQVRGVGVTITELEQHSDKISGIIQVIKDVADQTNLLALNAAIEAARAGEAGRGFAVVADEVRKLAERTSQATGEISQMISAIQGSSRTAVDAMNGLTERLQKGSELAAQAGDAIVAIQDSNTKVVAVVREINEAMAEQGSASQDIARRVELVAQASEQSNRSVTVSAEAAKEIHQLSADMRRNVERFRT